MAVGLATLQKHRNVLMIDAALLAALYLVPSISHLTAWPLYMLEPMRVAVIAALLFTNRANTYFIAITIPLASAMMTGHPEPIKAVLMGIEFSILVASYGYLRRWAGIPAFAAITAGILLGKVVYYAMKSTALSAGLLAGSLISTPLQTQLILAIGTAAVFSLIEYNRTRKSQQL